MSGIQFWVAENVKVTSRETHEVSRNHSENNAERSNWAARSPTEIYFPHSGRWSWCILPVLFACPQTAGPPGVAVFKEEEEKMRHHECLVTKWLITRRRNNANHYCGLNAISASHLVQKSCKQPWLVWLSGLSASLRTKMYPVQFPLRAHAWVAGQVPSRGCARGNHTLMFLSLPSPLPKNK